MKTTEATITSKGQVTVPASLRKALGVKAGDKLVFTQDAHGRFLVAARTEALATLRGIVGRDTCDPIAPVDGVRLSEWIEASRAARWDRTHDASEDDEA
ncbi:AbrB/MazE/SpoVT family DNA-binding domain-containing protein [Methylobacterium sp. J-077]|uniref:AbrB/MazE/SpoVT family DNA-binding domain-containing protein n=1 Tax=Methylobacterium sp. J-077 TaxID=2836656 RepID=UPI001FBB3CBF|nr:AbrB/MazE/SpoVT family DNA-binding domain-containing protein [Methylobacterium sp. J-077]MCJ2123073.1 type II toxin-antitoxin system PrlF family antitoxin [Methylobacterium sp. J-077]